MRPRPRRWRSSLPLPACSPSPVEPWCSGVARSSTDVPLHVSTLDHTDHVNDRPSFPLRSGRSSRDIGLSSLSVLVVAALLAGAGLVTAGLVTRGGGDDVVLEVDEVTADAPPRPWPPDSAQALDPSTRTTWATRRPRPPRTTSPTRSPNCHPWRSSSAPATAPSPTTSLPDLVRSVCRCSRSTSLASPSEPVGLEPDGQMEIPDESEIGWYQYGATAGQPGATVLAAHVSWNRTVGPFARLGNVEPGEQLEVALDDGSVRRYEVTERAVYGKLELPRERIWRTTGDETLVLITCGGDYNPDIRRLPREHRDLRRPRRLNRSSGVNVSPVPRPVRRGSAGPRSQAPRTRCPPRTPAPGSRGSRPRRSRRHETAASTPRSPC